MMQNNCREFPIKKNIALVFARARYAYYFPVNTQVAISCKTRDILLGFAFTRDIYTPIFPPACNLSRKNETRLRCLVHALFRHIIFFIPEALRRRTNKNMYYYRAIKYLYCLLKPYFRRPNDSDVVRKFFMERMARLAFRATDVNVICHLCTIGSTYGTIILTNVPYASRLRRRQVSCHLYRVFFRQIKYFIVRM